MSEKIKLKPSEVWDYYSKNRLSLMCSDYEIASNDEYGVSILLSVDNSFAVTSDALVVRVELDTYVADIEHIVSEFDCENVISDIYDKYLTSKVIDTIEDDSDEPELTEEEIIEAREEELTSAISDLLDVITDGESNEIEPDDIEDIKEHILEYIYRKHNIDIYRPMFLVFDDETESYEEYPYDSLDFEDKNNPIYMK